MQISLENLNIVELDILLAHLRLGSGHLKSQLNEEQLNNLLILGSLDLEQLQNISTNYLEKSGNIALVLNTVITSIFGAWMGFSGFMELQINSYPVLSCITGLAVLTSIIVALFNFRLTLQNAKSALHNQRIHNLQHKALKLITIKEYEKLASLKKYLNNSLNYLMDKSHSKKRAINSTKESLLNFPVGYDFSAWFYNLQQAVTKKAAKIAGNDEYSFYSVRLQKALDNIKTLIERSYIEIEPGPNFFCKAFKAKPQISHNPFIRLLSSFRDNKEGITPPKKWLKSNYLSILAGIFPTVLGGFASMFVFLSGGPNLARELGLQHLENILKNPTSRLIEMSVAVSLTLYYGLSFVYNNYKNYIREYEIEKTKWYTNQLKREDVFLKMQMSIMKKIQIEIKGMINIYTALDKLNEFKNSDTFSLEKN